ncbi:hypothetical protein Tco_1429827 [Tanacetum coccineum]
MKQLDPVHACQYSSLEEELSSEEDIDEWLNAKMEKHTSKQEGKSEEDALIAIIKSIREECKAVYKNKQLRVAEADLKKSSKDVEDTVNNDSFTTNLGRAAMDDMTQQETLGTVKNVLVKINKFEFPYDFVVTKMLENLGEMIILRRPSLETIHAQIELLTVKISLGIGEDRIKFDINGLYQNASIQGRNFFSKPRNGFYSLLVKLLKSLCVNASFLVSGFDLLEMQIT